jgi:hypothetical protein
MTGCWPDVDAMVGIDRVGDELLVLLVPAVEVMPREGDVIVEIRRAGRRLNRLHVAQAIPAHVIAREEVASERAMLMEQLRSSAVDHRRAAALCANPSRRGIDEQHLRQRDVYVEATGRPVSEWAGAHGEGHAGRRYRPSGAGSTASIRRPIFGPASDAVGRFRWTTRQPFVSCARRSCRAAVRDRTIAPWSLTPGRWRLPSRTGKGCLGRLGGGAAPRTASRWTGVTRSLLVLVLETGALCEGGIASRPHGIAPHVQGVRSVRDP